MSSNIPEEELLFFPEEPQRSGYEGTPPPPTPGHLPWDVVRDSIAAELERQTNVLDLIPADVREYITSAHDAISQHSNSNSNPNVKYALTLSKPINNPDSVVEGEYTNVIAANLGVLNHIRRHYFKVLQRIQDQWIQSGNLQGAANEVVYFIDNNGCLCMAVHGDSLLYKVITVEE
ncbi:hypothetical protein PV10_03956 [Exophiala mesophila]|uniref:Uncharacterized protein n=1 Tax=Exophiala mesophila TaxID=212818 RepID=A0A0D1ZFM8_EXOME|nr:uncharacterized protein PV10_03956 [Exophiala mesophila]KIV92684.1 hypothetical protein PV10_03956 [Exophiala mesophila]